MQAVVRHAYYDPDALASRQELMAEFEHIHGEQAGYAGNIVVDLGDGERLLITLWASDQEAAAARCRSCSDRSNDRRPNSSGQAQSSGAIWNCEKPPIHPGQTWSELVARGS